MLMLQASATAQQSTCTEWSMTRSTGTMGSMTVGSPPARATAERKRRQVDHAGHAGEVLQQHPGGHEGELGALRPPWGPSRGGPARHPRSTGAPAAVPQPVLQQDADGVGQPPQVAPGGARQRTGRSAIQGRPPGSVELRPGPEGTRPLHRSWRRHHSCSEVHPVAAGAAGLALHGHVVERPHVGLGRRLQHVYGDRLPRVAACRPPPPPRAPRPASPCPR